MAGTQVPEMAEAETETLEIAAQRPPSRETWRDTFYRLVPAIGVLRTYTRRDLAADTLAGLTVAAVALPQAMAYAQIADIPPQYGLYTAIVMTLVGALLDSSRQLINGPTNAISIAILSALAFIPDGPGRTQQLIEGAILLALLIGAIQIGITLLRLGDLTRYVSHGVIVGFTLGASVLLILDQLKNLLGIKLDVDPHSHFLVRFWQTHTEGASNPWAVLIGVGTIAFILLLRAAKENARLRPWLPIPEYLLAVIAAAALVWRFDLERAGVRLVGTIPPFLPAWEWPELRWESVRALSGSALAIAVLGLLEAVAMAKAIAARTGQKLDIHQQCLSEGVANTVGSFFQCIPGSGSLTRSAINQQAGAVSQWSGVIAAVVVALTVVLAAPLAYFIPRAALAGILMVSAWRMVDRKQLLYHLRTTRFDAGIVLATALSTVLISVEFCIVVGVFLSFTLFVPRAAKLDVAELTLTPERVVRERTGSDPSCERILVIDIAGELFFGSAPELEKHLERIARRLTTLVQVVVLRLKRARNPDAVSLSVLERFLQQMRQHGATVLLCGVRADLYAVMEAAQLVELCGRQNIFREDTLGSSSTLDAVRHAYQLLGTDLCGHCPRRQELLSPSEPLYYMI